MGGCILLPLGAMPPTEAKLSQAQQQSQALQAPLLLLHALSPALGKDDMSPGEASARAMLDTLAFRLRSTGLQVQTLIRSGRPATTILEVARAQSALLIILGSTIRGRIPRALLGSIADAVIRDSPCPVLLVRTPSPPEPAQALMTLDPPDLLAPRDLGERLVEVSRIVGSATRVHELDANFRLLHPSAGDEERYQGLHRALVRGDAVPPVDLYKFGFGYYVRDGHHRVAAARELGNKDIAARVTELAPFDDEAAEQAFYARRAFEQETGIDRIGAASSDSYGQLIDAIDAYRREQGLESLPEAASRWYETVYLPLRRQVRAQRQTPQVPGERPADVIARAAAWRRSEGERTGAWPSWDVALERAGPA
ncbi:MAG TPA: universal stress protein [Chloroflexota bacterium]|nr:universal stress protein [Chloroflexota bacterium]